MHDPAGVPETPADDAEKPTDGADASAGPDTDADADSDYEDVSFIRRQVANANDVLQELRASALDRDGLFTRGPISLAYPYWQDFNNKLDDDIGLRIGFTYYLLYQWASSGLGPTNAGAGDLDVFGRWAAIRGEVGALGMLGFNVEHRHAYSDIPPSELGLSLGSIWRTTRGFTDTGFNLNEVWWDQRFDNDRISFRVGMINQKHFYDLYRFKSQKRYFLNFPLSDSPTIAFPRNGLGGVARLSLLDDLHFVAGFGDANGTRSIDSVDTFFTETQFFSALDLAWTPTIDGLGRGRYSVTGWYTDPATTRNRPSGYGFSALVEQEIADGVVPFARYGYGDGADLLVKHLASVGIGIEHPFGQLDDVAGVGLSWGRAPVGNRRDQWGIEAYYRVQLTPVIQLTPGFQVIVDPALNPNDDVIGIFQLRFGLIF